MDGKNDHIVQSSISMIVNIENMSGISLKSAQNIPKICPECLAEGQQVPKFPIKSPNILRMFPKSPQVPETRKRQVHRFFGIESPHAT
jgi:hypothetical protein